MEIDLKAFCGDPYNRFDLSEPFSFGIHTYATDGKIFVRVARVDDVAVEMPPHHVDIGSMAKTLDGYLSKMASATFEPVGQVDLPPVPDYVPTPCKTCAATGRMHSIDCAKCGGTGDHTCPMCESVGDCDACDGNGTIERPATTEDNQDDVADCVDCDGTGDRGDPNDRPPIFTRVGPYFIDRKYVAILTTLPGVEIDTSRSEWHVGPTGKVLPNDGLPVLFRFNGGSGAVMPLRGGPDKTKPVTEAAA